MDWTVKLWTDHLPRAFSHNHKRACVFRGQPWNQVGNTDQMKKQISFLVTQLVYQNPDKHGDSTMDHFLTEVWRSKYIPLQVK